VRELRVYGELLHVIYVAADGHPVEEYFRNVVFAGSKGARELAEMYAHVAPELKKVSLVVPQQRAVAADEPGKPRIEVRRVSRSAGHGGRPLVTVHSSRVAFPVLCPGCAEPATHVAGLTMSGFYSNGGWWAVPVCANHSKVKQWVGVQKWAGSEVSLECSNGKWADAFAAMNEETPDRALVSQAQSSPLAFALSTGSRFVVYQLVASLVYLSVSTISDPVEIKRDGGTFLPSLPHSFFTLLLGWWSIHGLFATPIAIYKNSRGGFDVTENVKALVAGVALSPRGI